MEVSAFFSGLFKKISRNYSRMEKRQKFLLLCLGVAVFFSLFFNKVLKPQVNALRRLKTEASQLQRNIFTLKSQLPSLDKQRAALQEAQKKNSDLNDKLKGLEEELPESFHISKLLGELVSLSGNLRIDFSYIQPKKIAQSEENEDYVHLDIEMQFDSPYYDFRDYLSRVEKLSVFLNVSDILIEEKGKDSGRGDVTVTMVLSTLLSKVLQAKIYSKASAGTEAAAGKEPLEADVRIPFMPEKEELKKIFMKDGYILSGITFSGLNSTAIINNKLYRIGDSLENGWKVQNILENMVIISRGRQSETLMSIKYKTGD